MSPTGLVRGLDGALDGAAAYGFDGVSGCLAATVTHADPTTFTLETWFRTTSRDGGLLIGCGGRTAHATGTSGYDRAVYLTATGNVAFAPKPAGADGRRHLHHGFPHRLRRSPGHRRGVLVRHHVGADRAVPFTVRATNAVGAGPSSSASNSVTP